MSSVMFSIENNYPNGIYINIILLFIPQGYSEEEKRAGSFPEFNYSLHQGKIYYYAADYEYKVGRLEITIENK